MEVYRNFLGIVEEFRSLDASPVDVKFEGDNLAEVFYQNKAKWHKSCHLKFFASKLLRVRAQREREKECASINDQRWSKRHSMTNTVNEECCIFCSLPSGKLHQCATMELDSDLRKMAEDLQDTALIAKLSGRDLIAIEAKYHNKCRIAYSKCRIAYRNRHRSFMQLQQSHDNTEEKQLLVRAFAELVCYIENSVENDECIFKLAQLHSLYVERLQCLGISKSVNKTRLKKQILDHFCGECQEQSDGKNSLLVFNECLTKVLKESMKSRNFESEAFLMTKLVKITRQEIFDCDSFHFSSTFPPKCQENSVLKNFLSMLLSGPHVRNQDDDESQACLTISQLVCFNIKSKRSSAESSRHFKDRETPLPLYIGLNIHSLTRSKKLLNRLHRLGISINYNHVIELENCLASSVCTRFEQDSVVCPSQLRKDLFTVGAFDNIDHNLSSTTAQLVSWHWNKRISIPDYK